MPRGRVCVVDRSYVDLTDTMIGGLAKVASREELAAMMDAVARDLGFRYYALIDHEDLRGATTDHVDVKRYPAAVTERLIGQGRYRRDPVIRGSLFAGSAFLWSDLPAIIRLDRQDRTSFEFGAREGLNEGITVPYTRLGDCTGSCTFAGMRHPERAEHVLGVAQMIGIFAFKAALRLIAGVPRVVASPRLHPRPRDCIVLAGRGLSNKEIARTLGLTPKTVDHYLTAARHRFDAHDRTELVVSAILAGEVGLHELRRQPG